MTVPQDHQNRRIDASARWLVTFVAIGLVVMLARVAQLQVKPPEALAAFKAERTSSVSEPARRGDLLDRRGRVIAATSFGQRVFVDPVQFRTPPDADIITLADALGMPVEQVGQPILRALQHNEPILAAKREAEEQSKALALGRVSKVSFAPGSSTTASETKLADGAERAEADASADESQGKGPKLVRYVPLGGGGGLDDYRIENIKRLKLPGVHLETRSVREPVGEELVASIVGKVGADGHGLMGAERVFDQRVQPVNGRLSYVREAGGKPLWVPPGGYVPPQRGEDIRLSIDLNLQRIAAEELNRGVIEADAQGGRLVMLDPNSGEIVAMLDIIREVPDAVDYDWKTVIPKDKHISGGADGPRYRVVRPDPARQIHPALGRNRCVEDIYEPGSTFKPFMWAATTELGLARPDEVFNTYWGHYTTPYGRHIADVVKRETMTWREVLVNSSNVGMVQGTARMDFMQMRDAVVKFGFGHTAGTGLPGESGGIVTSPKGWTKFTQTSVAFGHEVAVTTVQMVRAFSTFARTGAKAGTLPPVRLTAAEALSAEQGDDVALADGPAGTVEVTKRVLPPDVAELVRDTLRGVTAKLDERLAQRTPPEAGWRYELFGKSGTADVPLGLTPPGKKRPKGSDGYFRGQYSPTFIAGGPVEDPKLVVVVVIDDPGPELIRNKQHYGAYVAGPIVRRVMERSLAYLGAPVSLNPNGTHVDAQPTQ